MKNVFFVFVVVLFFGGAYFMGNYAMGTINDSIGTQIVSSFCGVVLWLLIGLIVFITIGIYKFIGILLSKK